VGFRVMTQPPCFSLTGHAAPAALGGNAVVYLAAVA